MAAEAPVYRSPRLHNLDPTAAADEGSTRHYYTLVRCWVRGVLVAVAVRPIGTTLFYWC